MQDFQLPAKAETDLKALLKNFLRHSFAPPREISGEEDICLFAQKGAWSRLAVFLAHFFHSPDPGRRSGWRHLGLQGLCYHSGREEA